MINFEKKSYERYTAIDGSERSSMEEIEVINSLYFNKLLIPPANPSKIEIPNKEREDFTKLARKEKETYFKIGIIYLQGDNVSYAMWKEYYQKLMEEIALPTISTSLILMVAQALNSATIPDIPLELEDIYDFEIKIKIIRQIIEELELNATELKR